MSDHLLEAISLFLTFQNVGILFLGVLIGAIVGAIPGMTTPMGVALALPFTFTMHPVTGILLLLGIYKGGMYGGSITAILIKAPGTPAASCTVLDGYPLTRKGEARKALDIALYASCFADFVSNLSLILLAGVLAGFALKFGPPEFFTLIVFSLTIIAGVSGRNLVKGMVSAALGLLFATIGLDMVYGTNRFIFDNWNLMGGLSFIPVLIGLFALPEIIHYFTRRLGDVREATTVSGAGAGMADFRRCFKSIVRGSLIGVVLGAIPGIGGAPSAFLSYSEARRTSPNSRNFGKGELEGVAAAEAGNNGVAGATMIPLLALGVPGDVITAVILGAFMIHGLRPGPMMFVDNLPMIYALFIGIMLSSVYPVRDRQVLHQGHQPDLGGPEPHPLPGGPGVLPVRLVRHQQQLVRRADDGADGLRRLRDDAAPVPGPAVPHRLHPGPAARGQLPPVHDSLRRRARDPRAQRHLLVLLGAHPAVAGAPGQEPEGEHCAERVTAAVQYGSPT